MRPTPSSSLERRACSPDSRTIGARGERGEEAAPASHSTGGPAIAPGDAVEVVWRAGRKGRGDEGEPFGA